MFVIPYGHIQMKSKLDSIEVENRLKEQLEPQRFVSGIFRGSHKYFEGELNKGQFKINPVIEYRNSFNPVITGKIHQEVDGTVVDMSVRLDFLVILLFSSFFAGLFSFVVLPEISLLIDVFVFGEGRALYEMHQEGHFFQVINMFALLALPLYFFMIIPFNTEAAKVIKYLEHLFVVNQESSQ